MGIFRFIDIDAVILMVNKNYMHYFFLLFFFYTVFSGNIQLAFMSLHRMTREFSYVFCIHNTSFYTLISFYFQMRKLHLLIIFHKMSIIRQNQTTCSLLTAAGLYVDVKCANDLSLVSNVYQIQHSGHMCVLSFGVHSK